MNTPIINVLQEATLRHSGIRLFSTTITRKKKISVLGVTLKEFWVTTISILAYRKKQQLYEGKKYGREKHRGNKYKKPSLSTPKMSLNVSAMISNFCPSFKHVCNATLLSHYYLVHQLSNSNRVEEYEFVMDLSNFTVEEYYNGDCI